MFYLACVRAPVLPSCRNYSSNNSLLAEINLKMFRVLDDSSARNLGGRAAVTKILKLAQELRQSGESFDCETYEHILSAYGKCGENQAFMLHKQMKSQGIKPSRTFFQKALQVKKKKKAGISHDS